LDPHKSISVFYPGGHNTLIAQRDRAMALNMNFYQAILLPGSPLPYGPFARSMALDSTLVGRWLPFLEGTHLFARSHTFLVGPHTDAPGRAMFLPIFPVPTSGSQLNVALVGCRFWIRRPSTICGDAGSVVTVCEETLGETPSKPVCEISHRIRLQRFI
jgi:hypothetical protein